MSEEQRRSRVAWPNVSQASGNLDEESRQKIRKLLDDFGVILEEEAHSARVDIFAFPLFREFNLVAGLTTNELLLGIAPSTGLAKFYWQSWQDKAPPPNAGGLGASVRRELGWDRISTLSFQRVLLDQDFPTRVSTLRATARQWVAQLIQEKERQARIVRLNPIFHGRDFLLESDLCFVLMPFREPFLRLYESHIKPTLEKLGLRVMKANDLFTPTSIVEDIWTYINKACLIIADVTGRNPNVFYELGIAHTVGKDAIILTQNKDDIPFDLGHLRYFVYVDNEQGWRQLKQNLERAAQAVIKKL